jgi:ABC-type spermidine/putrescine transport system permease subunit II
MRTKPRHGRVGIAPMIVLIALLVVLYAPLAQLVVASVNSNPLSTAWDGFTTEWFSGAFDDPQIRDAMSRSLRLAVTSSVLAMVLGTAAAIGARRTTWLARFVRIGAGGRVAIPEIIIATGLGVVLPLVGWRFGYRVMVVAHAIYLSAYVVLLVGARVAGSDPHQEEAALDLGARPWRVLWSITLPDLLPAIIASGLLSAAFSFDDVALSAALRGPQDTTLPVYIFSTVQRRVTPEIHAIGTVVLLVGVVTFLAAATVNRALVRVRTND